MREATESSTPGANISGFWRQSRPRRFMRANLHWIVLVTVVVTVGAALYSWSRPTLYTSVAEVVVQPRVYAESTVPQPPDMGTERTIAMSGRVLGIASRSTGVPSKELSEGLDVTVPADANVLEIAYSHEFREEARRRATALARAYVASAESTSPSTADPAAVITSASMPKAPSSPNHLIDLVAGLVIGLLLGVAFAFVLDRRDDRLRSPAELEDEVRAPILAAIPPSSSSKPIIAQDGQSRAADAYRDLRTRLLQLTRRDRAKVLLITSASGEDRAAVAANLAVSLAMAGQQVVLVAADLRASQTHELFGAAGRPGLSELVRDRATLQEALRATSTENLMLLPAGAPVADPGSVLIGPAAEEVFELLRDSFDLVVVDGPGVLTAPDSAALADLTDTIVFVADGRKTTRARIVAAMTQLGEWREKLVGSVLMNARSAWVMPYAKSRVPTQPRLLDDPSVGLPPAAPAGAGPARKGASARSVQTGTAASRKQRPTRGI